MRVMRRVVLKADAIVPFVPSLAARACSIFCRQPPDTPDTPTDTPTAAPAAVPAAAAAVTDCAVAAAADPRRWQPALSTLPALLARTHVVPQSVLLDFITPTPAAAAAAAASAIPPCVRRCVVVVAAWRVAKCPAYAAAALCCPLHTAVVDAAAVAGTCDGVGGALSAESVGETVCVCAQLDAAGVPPGLDVVVVVSGQQAGPHAPTSPAAPAPAKAATVEVAAAVAPAAAAAIAAPAAAPAKPAADSLMWGCDDSCTVCARWMLAVPAAAAAGVEVCACASNSAGAGDVAGGSAAVADGSAGGGSGRASGGTSYRSRVVLLSSVSSAVLAATYADPRVAALVVSSHGEGQPQVFAEAAPHTPCVVRHSVGVCDVLVWPHAEGGPQAAPQGGPPALGFHTRGGLRCAVGALCSGVPAAAARAAVPAVAVDDGARECCGCTLALIWERDRTAGVAAAIDGAPPHAASLAAPTSDAASAAAAGADGALGVILAAQAAIDAADAAWVRADGATSSSAVDAASTAAPSAEAAGTAAAAATGAALRRALLDSGSQYVLTHLLHERERTAWRAVLHGVLEPTGTDSA